MITRNKPGIIKTAHRLTVAGLLLLYTCLPAHAQPPPPRPFTVFVNPAQGLIFGAFFHGVTGGSVTVGPDGSRSVTGDVVLANLGFPFSPAIYEVEADPGTSISILNGADATLTGSNGGSITLHIGSASTGPLFITSVTPPARTEVRIGGTLTIGSSLTNPAGSYSGSFSVTFIQE